MKKDISQEGLKIIACVTMLLDHIGAVFVSGYGLRIIGRIAFPIFCFLLAEGVLHTKSPRQYGIRLGIGMLLSEIPFDLLFFGSVTLRHQSVMVTLLIGFLMALLMRKVSRRWLQCVLVIPFACLAEWLQTDYGGWGVVLIALFVLTWNLPHRALLQLAGMTVIFCCMDSYVLTWGIFRIPIELFATFSMIPISFYRGRKITYNRGVQWAFYLFYPGHLLILYAVLMLLIH